MREIKGKDMNVWEVTRSLAPLPQSLSQFGCAIRYDTLYVGMYACRV
jgi:hypothetical protein